MQGDIYMTLGNTERVYQADQMNISPSIDAQIYGYRGDWVIGGLEVKNLTSTSVTLTAGRAMIQGRLIELKADTTYNFTSSGTVFLGVKGDLTQQNTINSDGSVQNNQYTFGVFTETYGNLLNGDVEAVIGLHRLSVSGNQTTSSVMVWKYFETATLVKQDQFTDYDGQPAIAVRYGNIVTLYGALKPIRDINFGNGWGAFNVPESMRPVDGVIRYRQQGSGMNTFLIEMGSDGWGLLSRYGTTSAGTTPNGSWLNIHHTYAIKKF